jgi:predicted aspartyl protease
MKTTNIAVICAALLTASCVSMRDFAPQHCPAQVSPHIPLVAFTNASDVVCVTAFANGRQGLFVLDTGCPFTVLNRDYVRDLDLTPWSVAKSSFEWNVTGYLGLTRLDSLTVGDDTFEKFAVFVIDMSHFTKKLGTRLDGIIGMNILGLTGCAVSLDKGWASLDPSEHRGRSVPITREDGDIWMDVQLNGRSLRMRVDTGGNVTHVKATDFDLLATTGEVSTLRNALADINGLTTNVCALTAECNVGNGLSTNIVVHKGDMNLLGMDFFRHWNVAFDVKDGNAYFEDHERTPGSCLPSTRSTPLAGQEAATGSGQYSRDVGTDR